jgi:hypothetical protein
MASLAYKFAMSSIVTAAVLTVLACVSTSVESLKIQDMTANNTGKNNDTMNDSDIIADNQMPILTICCRE